MERMTTQEIVKRSCKVSGADFKKTYTVLAKLLETNTFRAMRYGNSLLFYKIEEPKKAYLFLTTADNGMELLAAVRDFDKALRIAGFVEARMSVKDPQFLSLLKRAGLQFITTPISAGDVLVTMKV